MKHDTAGRICQRRFEKVVQGQVITVIVFVSFKICGSSWSWYVKVPVVITAVSNPVTEYFVLVNKPEEPSALVLDPFCLFQALAACNRVLGHLVKCCDGHMLLINSLRIVKEVCCFGILLVTLQPPTQWCTKYRMYPKPK